MFKLVIRGSIVLGNVFSDVCFKSFVQHGLMLASCSLQLLFPNAYVNYAISNFFSHYLEIALYT